MDSDNRVLGSGRYEGTKTFRATRARERAGLRSICPIFDGRVFEYRTMTFYPENVLYPPTLVPNLVAGLPQTSALNASTTECGICMGDLVPTEEDGDIVIVETMDPTDDGKIRCGHKFHKNCITPWLSEHHTCPVCRGEIRKIYPGFPKKGGSRKRTRTHRRRQSRKH